MSKTLFLMRHAKSSWPLDITDYERPLSKHGVKQARYVAAELVKKGLFPSKIICSTAIRACETWEHMQDRMPLNIETFYTEELYQASVSELKKVAKKELELNDSVLLLGHNPGMEDWVTELAGQYMDFGTANLAVFKVKDDLNRWEASLIDCIHPTGHE